ncbi:tetratricopeptide repeat protein [Azospirillum doebereinerae]
MVTLQDALTLAVRMQADGQLDQAAALHERILAAAPEHADAWHLSGLVAWHRHGPAAGARRIESALALHPGFAEAMVNLAGVQRDLGHPDRAAATLCRASRLKPALAEAYAALAALLFASNRRAEAVAVWRRGLLVRPDQAGLGNALGNALQEMGDPAAETAYRAALAADPALASAWANRGAAARRRGRPEEARSHQRRSLRCDPAFPAGQDGLGLSLLRLDRPTEAAAAHRRAIALQPGFAGAHANLGNAWLALNRADAAVAAYRRAVTLAPALPDPHRNLGIALLLKGELEEGWPEYEWRLRCADSQATPLPRPQWTGEALDGRTILLHSEQGLGDALHFARYVPLVAGRGGRVVLCAPPALERLLAPLPGVERFVPAGTPLSLAGIDLHAPLLSLPHAFGTTLAGIPARVPYLAPPPSLAAAWARRLDDALGPRGGAAGAGGLRVGIAWAGSPGHGNDRNRSLPLDAILQLAGIPGIRLVSVQKGPAAGQLADRAAAGGAAADVVNLDPEIGDFADTATILANLDLVVCVDTSVAHLAGALGRPAWVLLPFAPDWRWMLHRTDNPWYPTLRLFRQAVPGDWGPVLAAVSRCLGSLNGT